MTTSRRLTAILAADVVGYSRLMGADEEGTLERLKALRREVVDPTIVEHRGRLVKTTGDGLLVEFASVVDAVRCGVAMQRATNEHEVERPPESCIQFRIGINLGDIVVDGDDILGDGVNIAARLESIAEPGSICISGVVYEQVRGKVEADFTELGEQSLKNIAQRVRLYSIGLARQQISRGPAGGTQPSLCRLSVVVLPFLNMTADPENEYFVDGLTENLTTDLSRYRSLFVIGRNTAFTYKGKSTDLKQIGRDLAVRYVVEGSVQSGRDRIRVNVQLVDCGTGAHLWAERFDRERRDVFELQDEIAHRIARSIDLQLIEAEDQRDRPDLSRNTDSIDLFLRGQAIVNRGRTRENFLEALDFFEKAVGLDERNAPALAHIARFRSALLILGWSPSPIDDLRRATEAADRALRIDPRDSRAYHAQGHALLIQKRYAAALDAYERAVEMNPSDPWAHIAVGLAKIALGRSQEAFVSLSEAMAISPRDPIRGDYYALWGLACWDLGRYEEAAEWLGRSVLVEPDREIIRAFLASTYLRMGRDVDARREVATITTTNAEWTIRMAKASVPMSPEPIERLALDLREVGLPE
jgi:TolB-like protein/class 3 adenylate cyclase/Flp pilus assembly protein TadD